MKKSNYQAGRLAENLAKIILFLKGYKILDSNFITGRGTNAGEIDIIAKKSNYIVFVEVKKRTSLEDAAYSISNMQKQRISNGAKSYIAQDNNNQNCNYRFDAFLFDKKLKFKHIKNAWLLDF